MTLSEIKHIVEIAGTYDLDFSDQMDEFDENVYEPVRKAVANNDKTAINYIWECAKEEQRNLYTAIKAGVIEGQHSEAKKLWEKIRSDNGYMTDDRIKI